jgi:hypothetical protein
VGVTVDNISRAISELREDVVVACGENG